MSHYVAVLRLADQRRNPGLPMLAVCATLARLPGVQSVEPDWTAGPAPANAARTADSLVVTFDRAKVSLGEIVRAIEDHGVPVRGVAQSRSRASDPARLASA